MWVVYQIGIESYNIKTSKATTVRDLSSDLVSVISPMRQLVPCHAASLLGERTAMIGL